MSSVVAQPASSSFLLFGVSLIGRLRALTLKGTEWMTAQAQTLRLKLLKIGGVITKNTRRIRDALQPLSLQGTLYSSSFEAYPDLIINVLPRHGKKNGGKGVLCPKSENNPKSSQKYSQINSLYN